MKIYFAGSMKGGTGDAGIYRQLINILGGVGKVLTEHVCEGPQNLPPAEIFSNDMQMLRESDCFVAEITQPSLGVGYEIKTAVGFKIPVLCLHYSPPEHISPMIAGDPWVQLYQYKLGDNRSISDEECAHIVQVVKDFTIPIRLTPEEQELFRALIVRFLCLEPKTSIPEIISRREAEAFTRMLWAGLNSLVPLPNLSE